MLRFGTMRTRRAGTVAFVALGPDDVRAKPPVFLVHPINLRKECWLDVMRAISQERLCVAVDLTGHGESSDESGFTLEGWVSDCLDVTRSLELGPVHVVGGSLGGAIAVGMASESPTTTLSVSAMGAYLGDEEGEDNSSEHVMAMLDTTSMSEFFSELVVDALAPQASASLVASVTHLTNAHGKYVVRRVLQTAHRADVTPWVPLVRCPALVITGEFDTSCPPVSGRVMAQRLGGTHYVLPGIGHLPMMEDAAAVLRPLQPHLAAADQHAVGSAGAAFASPRS